MKTKKNGSAVIELRNLDTGTPQKWPSPNYISKTRFFQTSVIWKKFPFILNNISVQFQPNRMIQNRENGQKPSKMAIFDKKLLIKIVWESENFLYIPLTSCKKSKKSENIYRRASRTLNYNSQNAKNWPSPNYISKTGFFKFLQMLDISLNYVSVQFGQNR